MGKHNSMRAARRVRRDIRKASAALKQYAAGDLRATGKFLSDVLSEISPPTSGWLSDPAVIADVLLTAAAQGEQLVRRPGPEGALYATYAHAIEPMRRLAADLRRGVVDPLPVKWDPGAPWTSGIEALRTYGRFPLATKGRWLKLTS